MTLCQFMQFTWHPTATLVVEEGREFKAGIHPCEHLTTCTKHFPHLGINKVGSVWTTGILTAHCWCSDVVQFPVYLSEKIIEKCYEES